MAISAKYYTVDELMAILSISRRTVYRWVKNRIIGATRFGTGGTELRFSAEQVEAFLHTENASSKLKNVWEND